MTVPLTNEPDNHEGHESHEAHEILLEKRFVFFESFVSFVVE